MFVYIYICVCVAVKNSFGHLLITLMKQLDVSEWSRMFDMLIGYTSSSEPILDFLLRVLQEFGEEVIDRQQTSRYNQQRVSLIVIIILITHKN